jgi:oxaloacetate decarboxylase alpha subunit
MEKRSRASEREALKLIEEMLQLMESRSLIELELEHEGMRIRLKKASPVQGPHLVEYIAGTPQPATPPSAPSAKASEESGRRIVIKSPMVGTFYRAPAPDAPSFVEVGQEVEEGQVVCIIEAMKLMNEIKSDVAGRMVEMCIENGEAVEFGQALFGIEPR